MLSKRIKTTIICSVISIIFAFPGITFADSNIQTERLGGQDRYDTNSQIVSKGWLKTQSVILVNSQMYADAIVSAPLSKKYTAPILLTEGNVLSQTAKDKIQSLGAKNIYIIGGTGVISINIEKNLKSQGYNVVRIAGKDRYNTSLQVAKYFPNPSNIFFTDGANWQDALSISPVAANKQSPIILGSRDTPITSIKNYIVDNLKSNVVILDDNNFMTSKGVREDLISCTPIHASNSLEMNKQINDTYRNDLDFVKVFLANDSTFADALSGSALAALNNNPIILINNNNQDYTKNIVVANKSNIKTISILGGTGVISNDIVNNVINSTNTNQSSIPDIYPSIHSDNNGNFTNFADDGIVNMVSNNDIIKSINNENANQSNSTINNFYDTIGKSYADKINPFLLDIINSMDTISINMDKSKGLIILKQYTGKTIAPYAAIVIEYNKDKNKIELLVQNDALLSKDVQSSLMTKGMPIITDNTSNALLYFDNALDKNMETIDKNKNVLVDLLSKNSNLFMYIGLGTTTTNFGTCTYGMYTLYKTANSFIVFVSPLK
ncbi:cell wall-binding repeat-containing protein [Clostridium tyrobutyricum]|uniref:cell wall-binding repeat-containing protein n=1 Tax=Clostridium tyrobutyricum TaxID=1519 RepID=UPI001C38F6F5|nr:cell wall-binding repeat-containing protein [Clostridium tyrobutyricum]MBV4420682.1 cell wall-binding repeat-containing protein [Clostridium tyrobutyricum]